MGEVWEAEQREPIRRRVAVKIIKRGMDTAKVVSRFEAERQALALMDHPWIARVFDAGETPEGRPFFAMELVRGAPIHDFCDQRRLTLRQRLELMLRVCEGVQHAHQKAILHRDLKPSNILVTDHDGEATPKIIDFGVAKATSQPLTEGTLFTELGQLVGTPEYMSPEQAARRAEILVAKAQLPGTDRDALLDQAEADARSAVSLLEDSGGIQTGLGKTILAEALLGQGRTDEARREFKEGKELMIAEKLSFTPRFERQLNSREQRIFDL